MKCEIVGILTKQVLKILYEYLGIRQFFARWVWVYFQTTASRMLTILKCSLMFNRDTNDNRDQEQTKAKVGLSAKDVIASVLHIDLQRKWPYLTKKGLFAQVQS